MPCGVVEAFGDDMPCAFCLAHYMPRYGDAVKFFQEMPDFCEDRPREEMRRYLYRNVACEFRKAFSDFHQMPDLPGWE